jgi:hypothetical protein
MFNININILKKSKILKNYLKFKKFEKYGLTI